MMLQQSVMSFNPLSLNQIYGSELVEDKYLAFQTRCDQLSQLFGGARLTYTVPATGQYVVSGLSWFFPDSIKANGFASQVEFEFGSQGRGLYAYQGYLDGVIPEPTEMVSGIAVAWSDPLGESEDPPPPPPPPPYQIETSLFPLLPLSFGVVSSLIASYIF